MEPWSEDLVRSQFVAAGADPDSLRVETATFLLPEAAIPDLPQQQAAAQKVLAFLKTFSNLTLLGQQATFSTLNGPDEVSAAASWLDATYGSSQRATG